MVAVSRFDYQKSGFVASQGGKGRGGEESGGERRKINLATLGSQILAIATLGEIG